MRTKSYCSVENCDLPAYGQGYCNKHYQAWKRNGDPLIRRRAPKSGRWTQHSYSTDYEMVHVGNKKYKFKHVVLAEKALGRPLPAGAEVHHVDRDGMNNNTKSPWNLVICPSHAYHGMLHARARALGYEQMRSGYSLTVDQHREIRASTEPIKILAKRYGVSKSTIREARSARKAAYFLSIGINLVA